MALFSLILFLLIGMVSANENNTINDNINDIVRRIRAALDRESKIIGGSYEMDTKLVIEPVELDDYMLEEVCKQQASWLSQGKKLVPISVNVSRAHFAQDNLAEHILGIVDKYQVPHEFIELELTESAFFDDKQALLKTVRSLKDYGFKISMDDFGAGYSSLNSLKELPLDIIKLDAEFFRGVDDLERSNQIVGDTISLAKKLGMKIVAEGIETREQVDFLAKQNCDLIQGFYFSKPLPINEFEQRAGY